MRNSEVSVLIVLAIVVAIAVPVVQASPGWSWSINYQLDQQSYTPGSKGTVSFSLTNKGDVRLRITQVGIQFEWQPSDKWWTQSVNVILNPGQQATLGPVSFEVPSGTAKGKHKFKVGVTQSHEENRFNPYTGVWYSYWVDDGTQFGDKYNEIVIEELKPVLSIVSVTGLPPLNRPAYVGETSIAVVVISNTGNAKAQAVRVSLENLSPSTGLIVTSSDAPKDLDPGEVGQWKIDVRSQLPGSYTGTLRVYVLNAKVLDQNWKLEVVPPEISIVRKEISPQEGSIYLGDVVIVTYRLRNLSPVDVKSLEFNIDAGGSMTIVESIAVTEIASQSEVTATLKMRANRVGTATIQVTVMAYGASVQQDKFSLTISELPLWLQPWFLPAIAVAAVLLVVVVVLWRRTAGKSSSIPPQQRISSASSATCPRCGKPLTYVQARSKHYCTRCKEYF